jgi:hypothetical protein
MCKKAWRHPGKIQQHLGALTDVDDGGCKAREDDGV